MQKKCPHCHHQTLQPTQYEGEEIDLCTQCGGMWFDHASVNRMIREINDGSAGESYQAHFGDHLGLSEAKCPACSKNMDCHHMLRDYHVKIDVCHDCDGVWLDQDEAEAVRCSQKLREALAGLNAKVNWKTYMFQFLSRMPVEYNVKPAITPWVTYSLIVINTLVFLAYFYDPGVMSQAIEQYALWPNQVAQGDALWGIVTSTFLHGSVMHLIGNMYFLYVVGDNLEDAVGHKAFLGWYLVCGVLAAFASVAASVASGSNIPSVGASGAIAGLFGMYLMWFRHASLSFMFVVYQKKLSAIWFFAIWLALDIGSMLLLEDGVDHGAHIGGFVVGLLIGWSLKEKVEAANPLIRLLNQKEAQISR